MLTKLLKNNASQQIGLPEHVVLKRSARARRMALRLDTKGRVFNLILPRGVSLKRAQRFAEENETWMQEQLAELAEPIYYDHGVTIPIFGRDVEIQITQDDTLKRTVIALEDNTLFVRTNQDDPTSRIKRYLKKLVKEEISILAHAKAATISKTVNKIQVRDTKTRWGSCSEDANLNFSWRLIFAPYESLDYVVGHEVAHLVHMDHSKAFWSVCRSLCDNYVEGKYWMDAHGRDLMRYS